MKIRARTIPLFGILLAILLLAAACFDPRDSVKNPDDWAIVRSPISGRCYEIFTSQNAARAAMAPIPCEIPEVHE